MLAWFSANAFIGTVAPVKNGGIPYSAELKLVFNEGGAFEFYNTYTALLDRLHSGDGAPVDHLEDLPMYTNEASGGTGSDVVPEPSDEVPLHQDAPEDLPPSYDVVASDDGRTGRSRTRRT